MQAAIIGGRDFNDYELLSETLWKFFDTDGESLRITRIISGGADGADSLAARFAEEHNIELKEHAPDWEKYGKSAGVIRNELVIKDANFVIAFWDGKSRGTGNALSWAKKYQKDTLIIYY